LEKEKKILIESAAEKDIALKKKIGTIGNIVHDSVPISNNEVYGIDPFSQKNNTSEHLPGQQC
jgi:seryl-tRNA synthetase